MTIRNFSSQRKKFVLLYTPKTSEPECPRNIVVGQDTLVRAIVNLTILSYTSRKYFFWDDVVHFIRDFIMLLGKISLV